jgi:hypothetical protein
MDEMRLAASEVKVNAFDPAFLELLQTLEDVDTAEEAEFSGPWKLVAAEGGYALLREYDEAEAGPVPEGVFKDLPSALFFYAVLPSVGRSPLVSLDSSRRDGYEVSRDGAPVGRLRIFHEGFVHAAHVADCLTRSPLSLAALLLAAGPQALREVGRILSRVLTPASTGNSWLTTDEFPPR